MLTLTFIFLIFLDTYLFLKYYDTESILKITIFGFNFSLSCLIPFSGFYYCFKFYKKQ